MDTVLLKEIKTVLKQFQEYWDRDTLLQHKVIEDLRGYNSTLIEKCLENEKIRTAYSLSVGNGTIFKTDEFISMLRYKNYWENSYTQYSNEIGLSSEGKYLKYSSDVVIDFPHKDCVLEGGMTKEDVDREEIYYHKVLAKEEIDTLLTPKVLTNVRKYDDEGEHEITEISNSDNLIIKGNNLIALHTLRERYFGKVKLIYIDPPYNTDSDSFRYNDRFNHSTWLTFMKNRLEIAQELMTDDGVICVQINDNEASYLKVLMDEVFGRQAYQTTLYVRVRYADKTLKQDSLFHKEIEQILIYKKNKDATITPNLKESDYAYEKFSYYIETKTPSQTLTLGNKKVEIYTIGNYEIVQGEGTKDGLKEIWATGTVLNGNSSGRFFRDYLDGRYHDDGYGVLYKVWDIGDDQYDYRYFTGPKKVGATKGKYYQGVPNDALNNPDFKQTKPIEGFIDLAGSFGNNRHEGGVSFGGGKKPEILLETLISYFSNESDIVMDFFIGSGTTPAVAHKMNRQYVGIEQMDYIDQFPIARLKSVINGDKTGASKNSNWKGGGSFVYAELFSLNATFVEAITAVTSDSELDEIITKINDSAYLDFKVKIENVTIENEEFSALSIEEKKNILINLLDANQMYLSYSEINDSQFNIDNSTKQFNYSFYKKEDAVIENE
ncbi:site-specific DNA-methyltransferase [Cytobacillus oceanisediminis]|uniref:site-specific DNA-methyltransferase n=1 Tax=Cytobacillus oceanisediminis TaxID=665099 RepID=UPI000F9FD58C|nr:site-specific DNA-methyltransferase [Cytobacillus oceanisediminis]MDK7667432.1 site-specific DNA-methyltransferase [Cytobacillus oceanisediminis]